MKINNLLIMIISLFIVFQCSTNNILQNEYLGSDGIILGDKENTASLKFDRYNLNDIKVVGDIVKINISYSGGCRDHEFKLIAQNYFGESDSPKAELVLSHNSNLDPCEAFLTEEHSFNLLPLKYEFIKKFEKDSGTILMVLEEKELVYSF